MKTKIYSIVAGLLLTASVFAQAPQKISYQAVIRNSSSVLITSTTVGMQISILQGSPTGTAVYVETQTPSTNANGLVSLEIGTGTVIMGTFATINWAAGPYFIKTETDPTGGPAYTIAGTNELMSVPYALFSANATPGPIGATGAQGIQGIQGLTGDTGLTGATGAQGTNGTNGLVGATGAVGTNGTNGLVGATGAAGTNGTNGLVGATGAAGTNGTNGLVGATGAAGTNGTNGLVGATGAAGTNGTNGLVGATGATGANGTNGLVGATGAAGTNGTNGLVGATGPTGLTGATGAAGTNAGVGGFTHYLGEAFNGGIIYYLYKGSDTLEHGLIVALTESTAAWQTPSSLVNADRTEGGLFNTNLMINSPAKNYATALGTGWYLPSIDELGLLYYNRYSAQKGLRAGNHTLLSNTAIYWSSTEFNAGYAYVFHFLLGYANNNLNSKTSNAYSVRPIRAF